MFSFKNKFYNFLINIKLKNIYRLKNIQVIEKIIKILKNLLRITHISIGNLWKRALYIAVTV